MSPDQHDLARNAAWHLFDFDPESRIAKLLHLTEAGYRAASFLDERIAPPGGVIRDVPWGDFLTALGGNPRPPRSPHLIFHLGHCGSTLLSRALAVTPAVLPLREPLTLRRLAAAPLPKETPGQVPKLPANFLSLALAAHARVFEPGQRAMIKATSTCNALAIPILEARPNSRALLMYVPLETYLAGLLGKAQPAADLRGHAAARLADWNSMQGAPTIDIKRTNEVGLGEAGLAVLAWLSGMRHLLAAARAFPKQCLLLEFESFLDDPESGLRRAVTFFGLEAQTEAIIAGWPEISLGYSKQPDEPYSAFNRRRTLARGRTQRGTEIEAGMKSARRLVTEVPDLNACARYLQPE